MAEPTSPPPPSDDVQPGPVAVVVIGMAGSGKTTFMQRIVSHLYSKPDSPAPYVMNLDPAVAQVPFESNVDIRDSVNYKEVMKQYNLGPNGGILTSLNLFATKIDQVVGLIEKRFGISPDGASESLKPEVQPGDSNGETTVDADADADKPDTTTPKFSSAPANSITDPDLPRHLLIDTPGQIEVFTWSASSTILMSALSTSLPTVIAYVIDTPRTASSTATFMANMLYAVSVLYRTGLPMVLVLNKADVRDAPAPPPLDGASGDDNEDKPPSGNIYGDDGDLVARCLRWMRSWESLCEGIDSESSVSSTGTAGLGGTNFQSSLTNSMSLVLDEFYNALNVVGVSAMSGAGVDDFFDAVELKRREFLVDYWPNIVRQRADAEAARLDRRDREMGKLLRDMSLEDDTGTTTKRPDGPPVDEPETISDLEDVDEDSDEGDVDEDDDDDGDGRQATLQSRYDQALKQSQDGDGTSSDLSFARYVMGQKMNGM